MSQQFVHQRGWVGLTSVSCVIWYAVRISLSCSAKSNLPQQRQVYVMPPVPLPQVCTPPPLPPPPHPFTPVVTVSGHDQSLFHEALLLQEVGHPCPLVGWDPWEDAVRGSKVLTHNGCLVLQHCQLEGEADNCLLSVAEVESVVGGDVAEEVHGSVRDHSSAHMHIHGTGYWGQWYWGRWGGDSPVQV